MTGYQDTHYAKKTVAEARHLVVRQAASSPATLLSVLLIVVLAEAAAAAPTTLKQHRPFSPPLRVPNAIAAQLIGPPARPLLKQKAATYLTGPLLLAAQQAPPLIRIRPEQQRASATVLSRHIVEGGIKYYNVNEGFADTYGAYVRGVIDQPGKNVWYGEVVYLDRFDDTGTFFSIGNTHTFNDRYYSNVAVGTSIGGFFWPSFRVDASLSRKWFPEQNFVSTLGVGYYNAKDEHSDKSLLLEGAYYFDSPWIVQAGVRLNESDPGSVFSPSGYAAVTYGTDKVRYITARYGFGQQGYQALTSPAFFVDFPFHEFRLTWREWVARDWGFNLVGHDFESPPYDERGFELGLFKEF